MSFDPAFSVGNLLTVIVMLVSGGAFICRLSSEVQALRREVCALREDWQEEKEHNARIHTLLEERLRYLEERRARDEGRRERQ